MAAFEPSAFTRRLATVLTNRGFSPTGAAILAAVSEGRQNFGSPAKAYTEGEEARLAAIILRTHITAPYRMWEYTIRLLNDIDDDELIPEETEYGLMMIGEDGAARPMGTPRMQEAIEQLETLINQLWKLGPDSDPDPEPDMGPPKLGPRGPEGGRPSPPSFGERLAKWQAARNGRGRQEGWQQEFQEEQSHWQNPATDEGCAEEGCRDFEADNEDREMENEDLVDDQHPIGPILRG